MNPDKIESKYTYNECEESIYTTFGGRCVSYEPQYSNVVPITPPFSYNYDCASVVLTIYTPVYLYGACMQMLFQPLFHGVLRWGVRFDTLPVAIRTRLPGVLWPSSWPTSDANRASMELHDISSPSTVSLARSSHASGSTAVGGTGRKDTQLINKDRILSTVMYQLAIFVTFGLCNPYLALAIMIALLVTCYDWVLLIGRFVHLRAVPCRKMSNDMEGAPSARGSDDSGLESASSGIEESSIMKDGRSSVSAVDVSLLRLNTVLAMSERSLARCVWPLIWTSCAFYGLICLDMAGRHIFRDGV